MAHEKEKKQTLKRKHLFNLYLFAHIFKTAPFLTQRHGYIWLL